MAANRYDRASRHLGRQAGALFWLWLLGLNKQQVRFLGPLQTHFTLPDFPERIGDLVAALADLEAAGPPWAICAEFQTEPDFDMPDRLLVILGLLRLTARPSEAAGDRYAVGAIVVNLTGQGLALRDHEWRGAGLHLLIQPHEWNLEEVDAELVMRQVENREAPVEALAFIPLMKGGNEEGMMQRWVTRARRERNPRRLADLGLAQVFAELVGTEDLWRETLKGWNMRESPFLKELEDQARAAAKAEDLLQILQERFEAVPGDLRSAILGVQDLQRLTAGLSLAIKVRTLASFRKKAGL
jgi:hypothetical protein